MPVGLAMVTNSLEDVPQISPAFLRSRYPDHAARDAIYVGILVMVAPGFRGRTLFARLSTELWQVPAAGGGVLVFDICDFNREVFGAEKLAQRIADNFPRSAVQVLDRQTWYVAELPEPIPGHPVRRSTASLAARPEVVAAVRAASGHAGLDDRVPGNAETGERRWHLVERHRRREQVALGLGAAELEQSRCLIVRLDAFGDRDHSER